MAAVPRRSRRRGRGSRSRRRRAGSWSRRPSRCPDLPVGAEDRGARARSSRRPTGSAATCARHGIAEVLERESDRAHRPAPRRPRRRARRESATRAESALGRGTSPGAGRRSRAASSSARTTASTERTIDDFKRSGLAHLLAVSGQNVVLLALLAAPLLALLGVAAARPAAGDPGADRDLRAGHRRRPLDPAGRGDGRGGRSWPRSPAARARAGTRSLLAAAVDAGAQPAGRRRRRLAAQLRRGGRASCSARRRSRGSLAGASPGRGCGGRSPRARRVTVAATLATAPLMLTDFGTRLARRRCRRTCSRCPRWRRRCGSGCSPPPPASSRGSRSSRSTGSTVCSPPTSRRSPHWLAAPGWAQVDLGARRRPRRSSATYAALGACLAWCSRWTRAAARACGPGAARSAWPALARLCGALAAIAPLGAARRGRRPAGRGRLRRRPRRRPGRRDPAEPRGGDPVLVDAGPPDADVAEELARARRRPARRARSSPTPTADHAGGAAEVLGSLPVDRLVYGAARPRRLLGAPRAPRAPGSRALAEGAELRSGSSAARACSGRRATAAEAGADPNQLALVAPRPLATASRMLLTGDAEAEAVPIDPGAVDVLKVAHHGSEDAGLAGPARPRRPRARRDLGRRRQPLRPPDAGDARRLAQRGVPVAAHRPHGEVEIDVGRGAEANGASPASR